MLNEFIMQMRPHFGEEERRALSGYNFEEGFLTEFKETNKFENQLAQILKVPDTVAVNNGTLALSLAALALGVKPGDEVIVPNFTMVASANAMKVIGAKPVFADIELSSWCIDRASIFNKINEKTKAVILVSANGRSPSYCVDKLTAELNKKNIFLIEDAAQSLGSFYNDDMPIGTKGNVATLSFSAPKIISTGQGGLVFSKDQEILEAARKMKDFGREGGGNDFHPSFGINSKFTELQAIVGIEQLKRLESRKLRRKAQSRLYEKLLEGTPTLSFPKWDARYTTPWFTEILTPSRDLLAAFLKENNVGTRYVYPPINKQPIYDGNETFEISTYISNEGLWLPSHMGVTDQMISQICELINQFLHNHN